jgi:O-antigen/teichoic acid export membrane protein
MALGKGRATALFNFSAAASTSLACVFAFQTGYGGLGWLAATVAALNLIAGAHTVWQQRSHSASTGVRHSPR